MRATQSSWWAAILLLSATVLFLAAGVWQTLRAQYKEGLQAEVEQTASAPPLQIGAVEVPADKANLRRVEAGGSWLADRTILLDNKVIDGVVGYEVVTPLRFANSERYVLVNRGWVKAPALRSELPEIATPAGEIRVEGTARTPTNRFLELGDQQITGKVWQNLTIERYRAWSNLDLQPFVIYQSGPSSEGFRRVLPAPQAAGMNADRHRGYALTWFGLAAVTIVLGLLAWRQSKAER